MMLKSSYAVIIKVYCPYLLIKIWSDHMRCPLQKLKAPSYISFDQISEKVLSLKLVLRYCPFWPPSTRPLFCDYDLFCPRWLWYVWWLQMSFLKHVHNYYLQFAYLLDISMNRYASYADRDYNGAVYVVQWHLMISAPRGRMQWFIWRTNRGELFVGGIQLIGG